MQLQFENTLVFFSVVADSVLVVVVVLDIRIAGAVKFRPSVVVYDLSRRLSGGISVSGFQESEHAARQIGFAEASRRFKKRGKAHQRRGGVRGDHARPWRRRF